MSLSLSYTCHKNARDSVINFLDRQFPQTSGQHIETLDLGMADISMRELPTILRKLEGYRINRLVLDKNLLGDSGAIMLASELRGLNIQRITLRFNKIGDTGAMALSQWLSSVDIDIRNNEIGPYGAASWVHGIVQASRKVINLSNNRLGDEGASRIARILKDDPGKVNQVVLMHNNIEFHGDIALASIPRHITVVHRHVSLPYMSVHPCMSLFLIVITGGLALCCLPCLKADCAIEGTSWLDHHVEEPRLANE